MSNNPYEAPRAEVVDYEPGDTANLGFSVDPQAVPVGNGVEWVRQGWRLYSQAPGLWIGVYLVFIGIIFAAALFPLVGFIVQNMLYPVLGAGLMVGCDALWRGRPLEFNHLFAGFSRNSGQLVLLGGLYCIALIIVMVVAFVPTIGLVGGLAFVGAEDPEVLIGSLGLPILIGFLLYFALLMPLLMAIWFAPTLIVLNDVPALDAVRISFFACLKNMLPFLLFGMVGLGLAILATLPLLLGWLVLGPWLACCGYGAYRDIFFRA